MKNEDIWSCKTCLCLLNLVNDTASCISIKPQMHTHCTFVFPINLTHNLINNLTCFNNIRNCIFRSLCVFMIFINYSNSITVRCDVSAFSKKSKILLQTSEQHSYHQFIQMETFNHSKLAMFVSTLWSPIPFELSVGDHDLHMKALHWLDYMNTSNR